MPESEELAPLIEACYTEEEAEFLTGIPLSLSDLEHLAVLKEMDESELMSKLDELAGLGLIFRSRQGGRLRYRLNPPRFVFLRSFFWPGREDDYTKDVASGVTRYYKDGFGNHWKDVQTKGLRALPIGKTIEDPRRVLPYEDVRHVLQKQDRFAVASCACRHRYNMDSNSPDCKHETETCLHFGKLADYIIDNGLGRKISRDEAEEILARSAEAGLVHAVSNWQEGVDTICNCCQCCCVYFQAFHSLKHAGSMSPSNYHVETNPETCSGCGLCVKRCPMDALYLKPDRDTKNKKGKTSAIKAGLCIGCGVCAYACPTESLSLQRRGEIIDPPLDVADLKKRYMEETAKTRKARGEEMSADGLSLGDVSTGELK